MLLAKAVAAGAAAIVKNETRFFNGSCISLNHCQYEANKYNFEGAEIHMLARDEQPQGPSQMGNCKPRYRRLKKALSARSPRVYRDEGKGIWPA